MLALLDELRILAQNGLEYADEHYDEEPYERILELTSAYYGEAVDLLPDTVRERFAADLGHVTPEGGRPRDRLRRWRSRSHDQAN